MNELIIAAMLLIVLLSAMPVVIFWFNKSVECRHKWANWSDPEMADRREVDNGQVLHLHVLVQKRRCSKCNRMESRRFNEV